MEEKVCLSFYTTFSSPVPANDAEKKQNGEIAKECKLQTEEDDNPLLQLHDMHHDIVPLTCPNYMLQSFKLHKQLGTYGKFLIPLHVGGALQHSARGHTIFTRINPFRGGPGL
jgi:hypothetical protein